MILSLILNLILKKLVQTSGFHKDMRFVPSFQEMSVAIHRSNSWEQFTGMNFVDRTWPNEKMPVRLVLAIF